MPEGDTLFRTADVLRRALVGEEIRKARGRPGGARLERLVGARVLSVVARGKHLLITFDDGLTLHSHLGMTGSWHRYAPGERWRRPASGLVALLETDAQVAVCFDAPVVELLEHRAVGLHPALAGLGPDLLDQAPDLEAAVARLQDARRAGLSIGEALLDQRAVAGLGNAYRSEVLFTEGLDPFLPAGSLPRERLLRLLQVGRDMLRANTGGGDRVTMPDALGAPPGAGGGLRRTTDRWVYARAGRPCRRCGTLIRSAALGQPPRRVYWCPRCQPGPESLTAIGPR
jgi:endonuclease VIII